MLPLSILELIPLPDSASLAFLFWAKDDSLTSILVLLFLSIFFNICTRYLPVFHIFFVKWSQSTLQCPCFDRCMKSALCKLNLLFNFCIASPTQESQHLHSVPLLWRPPITANKSGLNRKTLFRATFQAPTKISWVIRVILIRTSQLPKMPLKFPFF